jgi:tetratricopeptide (TPR) repeat protein
MALYIWGLAPTISWRDSPEFVTVVHTLGISHPAGSPTYTLLAKLLTFLPLGSIALRVNLFSALCGAWCLTCLFSLLYEYLTETPAWARLVAALSGALFLLVSASFWRFAEMAEVYTLQDGLLVVLIALLLKARQASPKAPSVHTRLYWLFAFLYGLSAGVHATMAFFLPAFTVFSALTAPHMFRSKSLAFLVFFFLLGFASYLYLPLRSLSEPIFDWSNPETFQQFLSHITDRKDAATHFTIPTEILPQQIRLYLTNLSHEFLALGIVLGLVGCLAIFAKDKSLFFLLALVYLGNVCFFVRSWKAAFGFLPSFVIFAVWIGLGVHTCLRLLATVYQRYPIRIPRVVVTTFLLGGILVTLGQAFTRHVDGANQAGNYSAELYGTQLLAQLPSDALLFSHYAWFPLLYLQHVEQRRPDLTFLAQSEILLPTHFSFLSKKRYPNITLGTSTKPVRMSPFDYFWALCRMNQNEHPLFWDADGYFQTQFDAYLLPQGLLFAFTPGQEVELTPQVLQDHRLLLTTASQRILHHTTDVEASTFLGRKLNHIGRYLKRRGRHEEAASIYQHGVSIAPQDENLRNNYGAFLLSRGKLRQAATQLSAGYEINPLNPSLNYNLGILFLDSGNAARAAHFFERTLALNDPTQQGHIYAGDMYAQLGEAYRELGRFPDARRFLHKALRLYEQPAAPAASGDGRAEKITWTQAKLQRLEQQMQERPPAR